MVCWFGGLACLWGTAVQAEPVPGAPEIAPFLTKHCGKCHGEKEPEGDLKLTSLAVKVTGAEKTWRHIAERLLLDEMPPPDAAQPAAAEQARVVAWIKAELAKSGQDLTEVERKLRMPQHGNRVDHDALFQEGAKAVASSPARLWRSSPQIYAAFAARTTKSRVKTAQPFTGSSAEGFKDYAELFSLDEPTIAQLLRNAQVIVELQVTAAGGIKEFSQLMRATPPVPRANIEAALRKEFQIVLNRDPSPDELARYIGLAERNIADAGVQIGAQATLAAIFLSPEALYRLELGAGPADQHGRRMLAPRELAAAIAASLGDGGPDAALLKAADEGRLTSRQGVEREVRRLLEDAKFQKPRILRFFEEYFEYPAALDVFKDVKRGEWRPEVLVNDTRLLIEYILGQDRDVLLQLLTTNKSFVNYKISSKGVAEPARVGNKPPANEKEREKQKTQPRKLEYWEFYNLPNEWTWTAEQPIELPADQRAGILTQPSWLAAYATNNENHAIRRGKWIRERLLGGLTPDLPITVDAQLPEAPEKTLRERMEITRQEYCWQCHRQMNPLGLALENFDYLGRYRTTEPVLDREATSKNVDKKGKSLGDVYRDVAIDATTQLQFTGDAQLDGSVENGVVLINRLAKSPRVRQVFVRHAFRYWMGRNETLEDASTLVAADQAYLAAGGSMNALILSLLTSDSFLYRTSQP